MGADAPAARGRHAPPPEVRLPLQRERLLRAAAAEFAERGYANASSESISRRAGRADATERMRAGTRAFLTTLADHPEYAQTLLVEIIAAGPLAAQRRDQVLQAFADLLIRENAAAASRGLIARFASPHDAFAIVGAVAELISRQVRLGVPTDVVELAPVIDRLLSGVLASAAEDS